MRRDDIDDRDGLVTDPEIDLGQFLNPDDGDEDDEESYEDDGDGEDCGDDEEGFHEE